MADDDTDYKHQGRANLAAGIAVMVLVILGLLILWNQNRAQQAQDCEFAGHHDCHPIDTGQ